MSGAIPKYCFLTKGVGKHKEKLNSFESALRDAGIASHNIVRISSILPPGCKIISRKKGLDKIAAGEIIHCVMAQTETNEPYRLLAASIGVAIPSNKHQFGYLSEFHSYGCTDSAAGNYAEDLAAQMLATTLGISFDPARDYDERKKIYKMSGKIVKTFNITQSAVGDKHGLWTTVLAAAVLLP
ncbi:MAG: pyruvoyl-dependent arginine decarboxylase [Candidatus Pacearchaeota archaeon]